MKILMVCLGNICRSPIAEGILRKKISENLLGWTVDSCGTANYHVGMPPDDRMIKEGKENNIDISNLRARQFIKKDLDNFDVIYVMDESNYIHLQKLYGEETNFNKVQILLKEDPSSKLINVPDPYYGDSQDFKEVFNLLNKHLDLVISKLDEKR